MNRDPRRRLAAVAAAALAVAAPASLPAAADDVHLTNGKVFEGVVARRVGDQVEIHLAHGTLRLPASSVARVEQAETELAEYLVRRRAVADDPDAGAGDWLSLALWARGRGLDAGFREATRKAAGLDPGLPELAPLMTQLGYVREADGPWLLPDELMARRGYVRHDGSWVTPGERAELLAAEAAARRTALEARRERERDAALADLAAAVRAQAEAQRDRARREEASYAEVPWVWTVPGFYVPVPVPVPVPHHPHHPHPEPEPGGDEPPRHGHGRFVDRVPGSLGNAFIPGRLSPEAAPPPGRLAPPRRAGRP